MSKQVPIFFTKKGYQDIKEEYNELEKSKPDAIRELTKAAELGDRSENAAYRVGKQKVRRIESRMRYLTTLMNRARVVEPTQSEYIQIGSRVTLKTTSGMRTFEIVGSQESDPSLEKLSYLSPLGSALLKKKKGDEVVLKLPTITTLYQIESIE